MTAFCRGRSFRAMQTTVLAIETAEGTYQLGSLPPNPQNTKPQSAIDANQFVPQQQGTRVPAIPSTARGPWIVMGIAEDLVEDEEGDESVSGYRVLCLPLRGYEGAHNNMPLLITIPAESAKRTYLTMSLEEAMQMLAEMNEPEVEEPEEPEDQDPRPAFVMPEPPMPQPTIPDSPMAQRSFEAGPSMATAPGAPDASSQG